MAWTPVLLVLLSHCTGSLPQPVLTQPPSLSASLGTTARLSCTLSSGVNVGGKNIYWIQKKPGSVPQLFLYYYSDSDNKLGPGVPDRVSGSKDTSGNAAYLHISGLQPADEADYHCAIWENNQAVFGTGTQVTVLGGPKSSPTVNLFAPSTDELATNKATVTCLVSGFYPGSVDIKWKKDGTVISQGVQTTKASKQADSKYAASSYLALTGSEWKAGRTYSCQVMHEGSTIEKKVSAADCS